MTERCYLTDSSSEQFEGEHEGNHTVRVTVSHKLLKEFEGKTVRILAVEIPEHLGRDVEDRPYVEYEIVE